MQQLINIENVETAENPIHDTLQSMHVEVTLPDAANMLNTNETN